MEMKNNYNDPKKKMNIPFKKKLVFISYSREDKEFIKSFIKNGQNRGFEIFVDEADKETGSDWKKRIINKIHSSQAAFLFISNNSLRKNSPIRELEIPEFIEKINSTQSKWRLIFRNNFKFFPVFIDYVDKDVLEKFDFKSKTTGDYEKLFEKYDIWNLESNDKSNSNNKMPSEMTKDELQKYWAELNLQMTNAVKGRKVTKMGSVKRWNSNPTDALHYIISSIRRNLLLLFLIAVSAFLFYTTNQESDQTSEVFDIGQGDVRIASLNSGDCFDLVNKDDVLEWNTYVQYRPCDLLHDGEVYYRENQLDFGDQVVGYTSLLNFLTQTCTDEFEVFKDSESIRNNYEILYVWDKESQALETKPFDMLCLTMFEERTRGSYVEDITGISVLLPNPGNKFDCDDFESDDDAQAWYELYFEDYGDVALLDLNNNGIACDEIRSSEDSTESENSTTTSLETTSTTTTLPITTTTTLPITNVSDNTTKAFEDVTFDVNQALKESKNKQVLTEYFDINNRATSWASFSGLRIETHWKTGVFLKWNGCDYTMGCVVKLSINGVNFGSHIYEGVYYTTNNNIFVGGLNESETYEIKLEPVDSMYQTYEPVYLRFSGSDWNTDDEFNPGWPLVNKIDGYEIYADQNSWNPPLSSTIPKVSIADQGSSYSFTLLEWDITNKYTHSLLFADDELIGILGNIPPQYIQIEKSLLADQSLIGKIITLISYDSPVMPGATYIFEYSD